MLRKEKATREQFAREPWNFAWFVRIGRRMHRLPSGKVACYLTRQAADSDAEKHGGKVILQRL